ncbi:MAG: Asp-tRNA(Asn)/Glu-tRNA(Gln) amidotransferase subunit GatA [Bacteroidetes bacterium]|nr:Asp-tRNA(Asn)/Glu-tRNA(Gln) amidotransferase subunit GatA [Bacteroidota bacterium]
MLPYKDLKEKQELIRNGQLSLKENIQSFLKKIDQQSDLNAFNFVFADSIELADAIEKKIINGSAGKLAGMVIAVKDVIAIKNKPLTCSSRILEGFISIYNATVVQKLIEEDALIIGKTNCDEFAMGGSNENSAFGPVLNPLNKKHVPGGSSGGSAAAVAAHLCDAAIGTDTGGSIRQPASYCGILGLKPTYGRVSRYGLTAYASSFDSIGPMAKNVYDLAILLEVMSGYDEMDSTSINKPIDSFHTKFRSHVKFRIGIAKEHFDKGLSIEVNENIQRVIAQLKNDGHEIIEVEFPHAEYSIATYYILAMAEASANLSRFDGARYGHRSDDGIDLDAMYTNSRSEGFGEEVKRRIMLGTYALSTGYYDAYYKKAQKVRRLIQNDFNKVFEKVDLVLTPTSPTTAFEIGAMIDDPLQMYLMDIYTTPANLAGIPGVSLPIGNDSKGLPIGLQFMSDRLGELKLLQITNLLGEQ